MAVDKILIQYEVDISKLQSKLSKVQKRLGVVERGARKSGEAFKKGFDVASGSLEDLEDGLRKIEIQLKKTTDPKQLKELGKSFKEQSKLVDQSRKSIEKFTGASQKRFKSLQSTILKIGGAIGIAFAADKLVRFGVEAVELAAKAEGISRAFEELNKPTLLDELKVATQGTVSELELMRQAVSANNFRVPLEDLAKFFQFATERSAATGESVDFLVNSLVKGIGRKSVKVIDNLGISVAELQKEIKRTGDFAEGVSAIIDKELSKAGDTTLTTAQQFQQFSATINDLKVGLGEAILVGLKPFLAVFQSLITGNVINDLSDLLDRLTKSTEDLKKETAAFVQTEDELIASVSDALEVQNAINESLKRGIILTDQEIAGITARVEAEQALRDAQAAAAKAAEKARAKSILDIEKLIGTQKLLLKEQSDRASIIPVQKEIARLEALIASLLGQETEAEKKLRAEQEKRAKDQEKAEQARLKRVAKNAEDIFKRNQKAGEKLFEVEEQLRIDGIKDIEKQAKEQVKFEIVKGQRLVKISDATQTELELIEAETTQKIVEINLEADEKIAKSKEERVQKTIDTLNKGVEFAQEIANLLDVIDSKELDDFREKSERRLEALEERHEQERESLAFQLDNREITEAEAENARLAQDANFKAQEKALRDKAAKEEAEIARKKAIRDKIIAVFEIGINTAEAIIKSVAATPLTGGLPFSAIAGAIGAIQLAAVLATPLPSFAKGKVDIDGPGTSTSDSILARISKHESVINAEATRDHKGLLQAANNHKLDEYINRNYVLPALKAKAGMDAADNYDDYGLKSKVGGVTKQSRINTDRIINAMKENDQQFQNYISW